MAGAAPPGRHGAHPPLFHQRRRDHPYSAKKVTLGPTHLTHKGEAQALTRGRQDEPQKTDETQPTSAGSNIPSAIRRGFPAREADDRHGIPKAWKVIDDAGLRGATLGGAQMSPKHPNFLIYTGSAILKHWGNGAKKGLRFHGHA
ncbi:hypothetical protein ACM25O_18680 [Sulfitobacter pontiacus]